VSSAHGTGSGWQAKFSSYLTGEPNEKDEQRGYCPICEDPDSSTTPSGSFNFEKGMFHCFARCGGFTMSQLWSMVREDLQGGDVRSINDAPSRRGSKRAALPTQEQLGSFVEALLADQARVTFMREKRGFKPETLSKFQIGWNNGRYTIPIYDADGVLVNVRRYKANATNPKDKMVSWAVGLGERRLFLPDTLRDNDEVILTEGELDAIIGQQFGFPCLSHTAGATAWDSSWNSEFAGKVVFICYDCDDSGRQGARKVAFQLAKVAKAVYIVNLPLTRKSDDLTNYFVDQGYGRKDFQALLDASRKNPAGVRPSSKNSTSKATAVSLEDSQSSEFAGQPLEITATIAGKVQPAYMMPKKVEFLCDMSYGDRCTTCRMSSRDGQHTETFDPDDSFLLELIDKPKESVDKAMKKKAEAPAACPRIEYEYVEQWNVEELVVVPAVDQAGEDIQTPISRRVYNVGPYSTGINQKARMVGANTPDPRNQRGVLQTWSLEPLQTDLDKFELTPQMREELKVFQPKPGQSPMEKMQEIAEDLEFNVTRIFGRPLLHMAYDVAWHSVMDFSIGGVNVGKGWIELLVIGDTRTGKSEAAIRLQQHYRSGVLKSCEGATLAGLVGGAQQVGNSWMVMWGIIPLNDRRLVILDEFSGLADRNIIDQMSSVRSSGKAQITKIVSQETSARTRLIWISNPDDGRSIEEMPRGAIEAIRSLVKSPEDIARFDIAISAARADVDSVLINTQDRPVVEHRYTQELCSTLVSWVWSRRAEDVQFPRRVERHILERAEAIGHRYVPEPPLIQAENVRIKLARIAAAIAARLFSTDTAGQRVKVLEEHVDAAEELLEKLYGTPSFGYRAHSSRVLRDREHASESRKKCKKWLRLHSDDAYIALQAVAGSDFKVRDFCEFAGMTQDEAQTAVRDLQAMRMVRRMSKGYIRMDPALVELLKALEDELDER
jgi:hypothetical protein